MNDNSLLAIANECFNQSILTKQKLMTSANLGIIINMAKIIANSLNKGGKLLLCGNGGSAADAQHLATELLVRFRSGVNRQSIPAIALAMDGTLMSAAGNDYGFTQIFARPLAGLGKIGDVLLGITTSGKSANVLEALKLANNMGIVTLGFLGNNGGPALSLCQEALVVESNNTARIQESHITAGHILVELIEEIVCQS